MIWVWELAVGEKEDWRVTRGMSRVVEASGSMAGVAGAAAQPPEQCGGGSGSCGTLERQEVLRRCGGRQRLISWS